MAKNNIELSEATNGLVQENEELQLRLKEANDAIAAIKQEKIDALVVADQKELKVYTQRTADKIYRVLIEKMHEAAITLDKNETILYCNSYFANMVGIPLHKVIGARLSDFIESSSKELFDTLLNQGWVNYTNGEVYIKRKDARAMPVLMSVNTLSLENNLVLSIILTDLTIRNKNQEEIRLRGRQLEQKDVEIESAKSELSFQGAEQEKQAEKLDAAQIEVKELEDLNVHKENVLATLSHDLRSPLAGIIGTAEHLKENFDKLKPADVKEMLELLYKASNDELKMLDSLLEWARIKYAAEAFNPAEISLFKCVEKIFSALRENAVANKLQMHNEIEEDIHVFADEHMLLSILQNLVSNSIKHTRSGGTITAAAKKREDKILIEVRDTGIGMSKKIMDKLFTPQLKTLSSEREENKGAGIGLLLVKGFVEKNGGEIWVESVEGVGSSFYFTLPIGKSLGK